MKKKDLMYADEIKNYTGLIVFSCIFGVLFLLVFLTEDVNDLFSCFIFILIMFLVLFVIFYNGVKKYKHNLEIKRIGQRIDAYIMDFEYKVRHGKHIRVEYFLIIKYFNPYYNQEMVYKTPQVNFDPVDDLGDRRCSVYITNTDIYVSDFIPRMTNQNRVWDENYIKNRNSSALLKKGAVTTFKRLGIMFLLMFLFLILFSILGAL